MEVSTESNGPAIRCRWERDYPQTSRPALGPPCILYNGWRVSLPGGKAAW